MKLTTLPVRPPTLESDPAMPLAAPEMAGPAALVTRERPSAALLAVLLAVSLALLAASLALEL